MPHKPFFSVIIPTCNSESYLCQCLASLIGQTNQDYEVIVVDKQSTDSTLEIIRNSNLPSLRIVYQAGRSLPEALDEGFNLANGLLLCWLNSDDAYARPDAFSIIQAKYMQDPQPNCFIYCNHLCIDENSLITLLNSSHWTTSRYERSLGGLNLCTGALFFSRDLFASFGGFGGRFRLSFEYLLIDYLFLHGKPIFIPIYVHAYRLHSDQLSRQSHALMQSECAQISSLLPPTSFLGYLLWLAKRLMVRILYSNPLQRRFWRGRSLEEYWRAHTSK